MKTNKDPFIALCEDLEKDIKNAYEGGVTVDDAEKLAAKFLDAQIQVGNELSTVDLDARMKKQGLKAIKAAVYLEEAGKSDKKPSDVFLAAKVDSSPLVDEAQKAFDSAEVTRNMLDNYLSVFRESHIYFRGISKGQG